MYASSMQRLNSETINTEILPSSAIKESEQKGRRVGVAEGGKVG